MKKITEKKFRNLYANSIIASVLFILLSLTYVGVTTTAFSSTNKDAIYLGSSQNNGVSLMFNVYQGSTYVLKILSILDEEEVNATFFVGGSWVSKNDDILQIIYDKKNEIGNHGYLHLDHKNISIDRNKQEIELCHKIVKDTIGLDMTLFAPPSGSYSKDTLDVAYNLNYKTIMWSKDTIDWRDKDVDIITSRATSNLKSGDLILMHPTESTVNALPQIIKIIKNNHFSIMTVSQNIFS